MVEKASPQITTNAGPGTVLGGQVSDTAHLSGGAAPTGSITFRLYDNPNCAGTPAAEVTNGSVNGNGDYSSPQATPTAAGDYFWVAIYSGDANNKSAQTGCSDPTEKVTITNPPVVEVAASKIPPPECKLRKARARVFIYTRHNRVRLVIRYVAYTKATVTTSYTMHGRKGNLILGKATQTFKKKGVFRLPKQLTPAKMKKIRAATDFGVQFQIPGTPAFCQRLLQTHADRRPLRRRPEGLVPDRVGLRRGRVKHLGPRAERPRFSLAIRVLRAGRRLPNSQFAIPNTRTTGRKPLICWSSGSVLHRSSRCRLVR